MFDGHPISIGFSVSLTVTLNMHCAVSPTASVAVQVTVVKPLGKAKPVAGEQLTITPGQLSDPVGVV